MRFKFITLTGLLAAIFSASVLLADLQSTTGNLLFDADSDNQSELKLDNTGMGIGTTSLSANLHVEGNSVWEGGDIYVGKTSGNSSLEIEGSFGMSLQSVSANAELEGNSMILADSSGSNIVITLPYAGNVTGREYHIKKTSVSNELFVTGGGNAIDDVGSLVLSSSGNALPEVRVISDGTQWYVTSVSQNAKVVASDNLVAWWKMDESNPSTTTLIDSSVNSNTATLVSFASANIGVEGKVAKGLRFGQTAEYATVPFGTVGNAFDSAFTISV